METIEISSQLMHTVTTWLSICFEIYGPVITCLYRIHSPAFVIRPEYPFLFLPHFCTSVFSLCESKISIINIKIAISIFNLLNLSINLHPNRAIDNFGLCRHSESLGGIFRIFLLLFIKLNSVCQSHKFGGGSIFKIKCQPSDCWTVFKYSWIIAHNK